MTVPFHRSQPTQESMTEAETMTVLRGFTDSQFTVALAQIKALGEL